MSKTLFTALVKFHKEVDPILKDKENPFHRSKYADLSTVIGAVKPAMNNNGLVVIQPITTSPEGVMVLNTQLVHESGEMVSSQMNIPAQADPQKLGSLITYYRRYSYLSIIGLASQSDDDDANNASNKGGHNVQSNNNQRPQNQSHNNQSSQSKTENTNSENKTQGNNSQGPKLSGPQLNALKNIYKQDFKPEWENISSKEASSLIEQANKKGK